MNDTMEKALSWDDEISKENEFELLPAGEYSFTVESLERGRFDGSDKMSACPKADLTLALKTAEGREVKVFDTLYLHSKAEWRLSQFFTAIGMKKKGEPLRMNWGQVPGSTGKLKLSINKYKAKNGEDRENNRVERYLLPEQKQFVAGQF